MVQHLTNAVWLLTWAAVIATEGPVAASTTTMQAESLNRLLRDNLVIECQRTGIRASFRRPGLDEARIQPQRLSFNDFSCRASNNGTHYVLTTTFAECGGTVIKEQGRAYNRIQLADSDRGSAASAARRRGRSFVASPGEDDDDESSGSGDMLPSRAPAAARRPAASEAGAAHLWSLPFVCEYSNRTQLQVDTPAVTPAWKLNMSVTFFQSDAYVAPLRHYPLQAYAGDKLYVQVSPEAGGDHSTLRAMISSCFLSSATSEGGSKRGILVDRGCAIDGTLWHGEDELASHRRFSFKATRPFPSFSFLHCTVDLCSLRPPTHNDATTAPGTAAGPKLCSTQAQYCSQQRSARQPAEAAHRSTPELVRVHSGALVMKGQRSALPDGSLAQPPVSQDRHLGPQQQQLSTSLSHSPYVELRATSSWPTGSWAAAADDVRASTPLAAPAKRATAAAHLPLGPGLDRLPAAPGGPPGAAGMPAPAGGLAVGTVIGIAVGAFVVGCITVGALWIIHTCTDPRRRLLSVPTTEDSGSQTSRSPMSV